MRPGEGHLSGFRDWLSESGGPHENPPAQKDYFWHVHRKVSAPRPKEWDVLPSPLSRPMHIRVGKGTDTLPAGTLVAAVDSSSDASPDKRKGYSGRDRDKWVRFRVVGNKPDKDDPESTETRTGVVSRHHGKEYVVPRQAYHMALQPPMNPNGGGGGAGGGGAPPMG